MMETITFMTRTTMLVSMLAMAPIGFSAEKPTPVFSYRIVKTYPHDPRAFTQGLVYRNGRLYESTGLRGQSSLRRVDLTTGKIEDKKTLLPFYFAEGLTLQDDRIYQLTWTSGTGFVYDRASMNLVREFRYGTEGWGISARRREPHRQRRHTQSLLLGSRNVCGDAQTHGARRG